MTKGRGRPTEIDGEIHAKMKKAAIDLELGRDGQRQVYERAAREWLKKQGLLCLFLLAVVGTWGLANSIGGSVIQLPAILVAPNGTTLGEMNVVNGAIVFTPTSTPAPTPSPSITGVLLSVTEQVWIDCHWSATHGDSYWSNGNCVAFGNRSAQWVVNNLQNGPGTNEEQWALWYGVGYSGYMALVNSQPTTTPSPTVNTTTTPIVYYSGADLKSKYCDLYTYQAVSAHTYGRDRWGPVQTPFLVQTIGDVIQMGSPNQWTTYQEFTYLMAYECSLNQTYLDWAIEYADWVYNNQLENGLMYRYNAVNDTFASESEYGHTSASVEGADFLAFVTKVYGYTHDPSYKARMEVLANAYWNYQVNRTTKIPHSRVDTRTLAPVAAGMGSGEHYWRAFDKWIMPALAQEAVINGNATHLQYLKTMAESLVRTRNSTTGLEPCCVESDGIHDFGDGRGPLTEYMNNGLAAQGFFEVYNITGDPYYLTEGQNILDAIDRYMWREDLGRHISGVWTETGQYRIANAASPTASYDNDGRMYGYMEPGVLGAYAMAYRHTLSQNATRANEYLRKAKKEMDLVANNLWTNGVPCKFELSYNETKFLKDSATNCRFPDVELSGFGYMYYYTGDEMAKTYFVRLLDTLTPYRRPYSLVGAVNTVTNASTSSMFYEYQLSEYLNEYMVRPPIWAIAG